MERKGNYSSHKYPQRFCEYFNSSNGLLDSKALCLAADIKKNVYIGTESGLNFTKPEGGFGVFACGKVSVISVDSKDTVYFASGKTLFTSVNGEISEFQRFEEEIVGIDGKTPFFSLPQALFISLKTANSFIILKPICLRSVLPATMKGSFLSTADA